MEEIKLNKQQLAAYESEKPYVACLSGKRSGKTFVGAFWMLKKITENPEGNFLIAAPTHKLLLQAALDTFFKLFPEYRKFWKKMEGVIDLPSGGRVYLRSTDEPTALEGLTLDAIWLDEGGMMKREVWRICRARISTTQGQLFITTTPYNLGWLYQEFYIPWKEEEDEDIDVHRWKTIDNPVFDTADGAAFISKERDRMRPEEFSREYEGEFTKMTGLVWDFPSEAVLAPSGALQRIMSYPDRVVAGIDWGFHNPAAIVVGVVKDATFYIVDEWKEAGRTTAEIIEVAKGFKDKYDVALFYPDPAEPDRIEEMKRGGLRVGDTNKDIAMGLSHVNSLIREDRLFITRNCGELLDEMSQYHYPEGEDGKEFKEKPVKFHDHLCDALRYMCVGYRPVDPLVKQARLEQFRKPNKQRRYV